MIVTLIYLACDECARTCPCGGDAMFDRAADARKHVVKRHGWRRIPGRLVESAAGLERVPARDLCPACQVKEGV